MRRLYVPALIPLFVWCIAAILASCSKNNPDQNQFEPTIESWVTSGDRSLLLARSPDALLFSQDTSAGMAIEIDTSQHFQTIDGFGFALTGGSAQLINQKLSAVQREALIKELFLSDKSNIGISYLRISMGASDLDDHVFSYDDLTLGQTDPGLAKFTLGPDKQHLIPVLKLVLAARPDIKLMSSPWSPPAWMKTNHSTKGGSLKPAYYKAYADYFVRYIKDMAKEGISIDAVTIQNEPENPNNNPSLVLTASEEATFIKNYLGPAFRAAGLTTRIVVFDHNCDHPEYPITILNDAEAKKYVDGSAFHLYLGKVEALSEVHRAHEDRNIYFTEQWTSGKGNFEEDLRWHIRNLVIGATRNWSRNVLEWNLAADPSFNPHTDGGCTECQGALTIGDSISRNVSYYIIAQASKFVRRGSIRVASNDIPELPNVAFMTPEGKIVLIVLNDGDVQKSFGIRISGRSAIATLPKGSVGTFVW